MLQNKETEWALKTSTAVAQRKRRAGNLLFRHLLVSAKQSVVPVCVHQPGINPDNSRLLPRERVPVAPEESFKWMVLKESCQNWTFLWCWSSDDEGWIPSAVAVLKVFLKALYQVELVCPYPCCGTRSDSPGKQQVLHELAVVLKIRWVDILSEQCAWYIVRNPSTCPSQLGKRISEFIWLILTDDVLVW